MPAPNLSEINTIVPINIMPGLVDNYFKSGPIMAWLKQNRIKIFQGGSQIQEDFLA